MRLIDADALMAQLNTEVSEIAIKEREEYGIDLTASDIGTEYSTLMKKVLQAPTIDAIEVVRCKDCQYGHMTYRGECKYCDQWFGDGEALYLDGRFYCGFGKRREKSEVE